MGEGDRGIGVPVLAVGEGITVADGVEGALVVIGIGVLLWRCDGGTAGPGYFFLPART